MQTQQMTLQGDVCKYMGMKVGLSKEFESELADLVDEEEGEIDCCLSEIARRGVAYVIVDHVVNVNILYSLCHEGVFYDDCDDVCSSSLEECPHHPLIETCIQQISITAVHELLHLCGCSEVQIRRIERELFGFPTVLDRSEEIM